MRAREFLDTLTGFEEIAIQQMTGKSFDRITGEGEDTLLMRALVAVKFKREDPKLSAAAAYNKANGLSRVELGKEFDSGDDDDDLDDVFEDEPVSESGKDESTPSEPPMSSPDSASVPG